MDAQSPPFFPSLGFLPKKGITEWRTPNRWSARNLGRPGEVKTPHCKVFGTTSPPPLSLRVGEESKASFYSDPGLRRVPRS